jgi:hypothetical protein
MGPICPRSFGLRLVTNVAALRTPDPLTAKNASGTVAQIYAEVRKRRAITQLIIETCIHR